MIKFKMCSIIANICVLCVTFLTTYNLTFAREANFDGEIIQNIIEQIRSLHNNGSVSFPEVKDFVRNRDRQSGKTKRIVYYETVISESRLAFDSELIILDKLLQKLTMDGVKVLLSLKWSWWTNVWSVDNNLKFSEFLNVLQPYKASIEGLSIQTYQDELECPESVESSPKKALNITSHLYKNLSNSTNIRLGVEMNLKNINCSLHEEYINTAEFFVIRILLFQNDYIFVESYGFFKSNLEHIINLVEQNLASVNEDFSANNIYYRIEILSNLAYKNQYEKLLADYCFQMVLCDGVENKFILTYNDYEGFTKSSGDILIPFVNHYSTIHHLAILKNHFGSVEFVLHLLEDIADSGLNTIAFYGHHFNDLAKQSYTFDVKSLVLPEKLIYFNTFAYEDPYNNYNRSMFKYNQLELSVLVFHRSYRYTYENHDHELTYKKLLKFNETPKAACYRRDIQHILQTSDANNTCNTTCSALKLQNTFACNVIENFSQIYIWQMVITYNSTEIRTFIDNFMKKLDVVLIARDMLRNDPIHKKEQIILQTEIKPSNWPSDVNNQFPLYCHPFLKLYYQYTEVILTWAQIHELPVLMDQRFPGNAIKNPVLWHELKMSDSAVISEIMKFAPLFIRRSYDSSKLFSQSWTAHIYPCIQQSNNTKHLQNLQFRNEHAGVTIFMNLKQNGESLTSDELIVLLLFTLGKFQAVEVVMTDIIHVQYFIQSVSNLEFDLLLKENQIHNGKIYLQLYISEQKEINDLAKNLAQYDTSLEIVISVHIEDFTSTKPATYVFQGALIDNCTDLARTLVYKTNAISVRLLEKVTHLTCETNPIEADNSNKTKMQEFLETHLYMRKLFQKMYPNLKEIRFRLSPFTQIGNEDDQHNNFFFIADVNNFAQGHQVHYFLLPALTRENFVENDEVSFWTVKSYQNLTNVFAYIGILDELLNQTSNRPTLLPKPQPELQSIVGLTIVFIVFGAILPIVGILIGIFYCYLKYRKPQTKRNGDQTQNEHETMTPADSVAPINEQSKNDQQLECTILPYHQISRENVIIYFDQILGTGQFGIVYRARLRGSLSEIALKMIQETCRTENLTAMWREIRLFHKIGQHPNIVQFIGCYIAEIQNGLMWILMELCTNGSLLSFLKDVDAERVPKKVTLKELIKFSLDIAHGMEYVSLKNIVHGDLATRNVLLDEKYICKIGDFGLSRNLYNFELYVKSSPGPLPWRWMAFESLKKLEFSLKSDVWSFGVTMWEIFTLGDVPYPGISWTQGFLEEIENGLRLKAPKRSTESINNIMQKCWNLNPKERPSFSSLSADLQDELAVTNEKKQIDLRLA